MKNLLFLFAATLFAGTAVAQELPQPSPSAKIEQVVGLTSITIDYSRPSVKGRTTFGELVPYDEVWRLGANACTKITTSTELNIQGQLLEAGTYAVFAIPYANGTWKMLFNSDTEQWGAGSYDATKDVVTAIVKTREHAMTETFTIAITDVTVNSANLSIMWDNLKVDLELGVETQKFADANIKAAIAKGEDLDKVYYRAAEYYFKSLNNEKKALGYIHKGLNAKEGHPLHFLRAQILKKQGHTKEAIESAEKAYELAIASENKGWAEYIEGYIKEWKKK
ncbi:MAG: tetratricopeptide (TPR) repeat protein [Crocinitomix sp.]|jgi:tetratricopeptide (TPR) repeat protein